MRTRLTIVEVILVGLAVSLLLAGAAVYFYDRPAGSTPLLSFTGQGSAPGVQVFGPIGASLPSLLHTFAFGLLTALVLPRTSTWATFACFFWTAVSTCFELGQHPKLSSYVHSSLGHWVGVAPWLTHVDSYFTHGVFDMIDIAGSWVGGLSAWLLLLAASRHRSAAACLSD